MGKQPEGIKLTKLPTKDFILVLIDAWEKGLDYVDLIIQPDAKEEQDVVKLMYSESYRSKDDNGIPLQRDFEEEIEQDQEDLSQDDLDELIN